MATITIPLFLLSVILLATSFRIPQTSAKTAKKESTSNKTRRPKKTASPSPGSHIDRPPPSYDTLYPPPANAAPKKSPSPRQPATVSTQEIENINTLRNGNPRLALDPPLPKDSLFKTAEAAAKTAMLGVGLAFAQTEPGLIAAHTAHAIAVAVSTSRSYTAFVAATTAAESAALIIAEKARYNTPPDRELQHHRNAIRRAAESAVAADAGNTAIGSWPSNIHDTAGRS